jgi:hypothetical protein
MYTLLRFVSTSCSVLIRLRCTCAPVFLKFYLILGRLRRFLSAGSKIKRTIPKRSFPKFSSHKNNGDNGK